MCVPYFGYERNIEIVRFGLSLDRIFLVRLSGFGQLLRSAFDIMISIVPIGYRLMWDIEALL